MRITVKGNTGSTIDGYILDYAEAKIGRIEKFYNNIQEADLVLSESRGRNVAEVTLKASGKIIRAEAQAPDIRAAIDKLSDKLEIQMKKFKEKLKDRARHGDQEKINFENSGNIVESKPLILREKRFPISPLTDEDAIEQMELLGHDFFIYYRVNDNKENLAVLYRRKDGGYGVLIPELR
jgi:putative sigma-54 modulation protein